MDHEVDPGDAPKWWLIPFFWVPLGILIWVGVISLCRVFLTVSGLIGGA